MKHETFTKTELRSIFQAFCKLRLSQFREIDVEIQYPQKMKNEIMESSLR